MKICWGILLAISFITAHDPNKENIQWTQHYRLGSVYSKTSTSGIAGYARLKRTTENTFNDIRLFTHIFLKDSEVKIRNKSSRRFLSLNELYSFNTLMYEKNTIIDVDLRYHYNQGLGYILRNTDKGNITMETGFAFDNSDYLNTQQKTTYIRGATSIDQDIINLSLKFEIDYYYQVNENIDKVDLSRFQILAESQRNLKKRIGIITGFTCDIHDNEPNYSFFLTISFSDPIGWRI
tara:strand:- start:1573 stop:2280 length:708 start_codon:yes stop_codon:yes gene_type:complete